jgi:hypothetical protein
MGGKSVYQSIPLAGPYFTISFAEGLRIHDHPDCGDGEWTDEEFAAVFNARLPEQCARTLSRIRAPRPDFEGSAT